jgi:hypothetical protein
MATIKTGLVTTTEVLPDSMVIDMREEISMADEDESQFSTFTMKSQTGEATREKINWREKDYFPRLATVLSIYAIGATTVVVAAGQGARFRKGDVVRNMAQKDAFYVTAVAGDSLTVVRNIGAIPGAAGAVGDTLLIASNASHQGDDFPDTAIVQGTLGFNYTQIFRHGATFSRTARSVNYYGRSEPDQESALKGIEQKRAIEYSGFWGARHSMLEPVSTGESVGFAGGLVEFVTTNKLDAAGSLTVDSLDTYLRTALQRSSRNVVMYCAPLAAQQISKFNRGGQGTAWRPDPQNRAGLKVDAFMSGVYGYEIPVVVKKDWNDFPVTLKQYGGFLFIVDHNRVQYKTLTGGSTKLLTNRQLPGGDRVSEEWLTECTWEIRNEASHGYIYGIT